MKKNFLLILSLLTISLSSFAIGPITGATSTCVGVGWQQTLHDVTLGGTWSSSNPAIATVDPSTGVVTGVSAGTCSITYSCTCGGSTPEVTSITFTVTDAAHITGPTSVCDGSIQHYIGTPGGGNWAPGPGSICSDDGVFKFTSDDYVKFYSTGVATIRYNKGACYDVLTVNVDPSPFCVTGPSVVNCGCSCPKVYTCSTPGGTWSVSNTAIATISSTGVITCIGTGCVDVIYTVGGCNARKTITITSHTPHIGSEITGIVAHSDGSSSPVGESNVIVDVLDAATNALIASAPTTGTGGTYSLTDLPDGNYIVNPHQPGYTTVNSSAVTLSTANARVAGIDFIKNTSNGVIAPRTAGVRSVASSKDINIFPNPTSGIMNIKWDNLVNEDAQIVVTDVTGREVYSSVISINNNAGQTSVDVSSLVNGLYFVTIKSENISYNGRLQISK